VVTVGGLTGHAQRDACVAAGRVGADVTEPAIRADQDPVGAKARIVNSRTSSYVISPM
jgi:hypothetical protein